MRFCVIRVALKTGLFFLPPSSDQLSFPHRLTHGAAKLENARASGPCLIYFQETMGQIWVVIVNDTFYTFLLYF